MLTSKIFNKYFYTFQKTVRQKIYQQIIQNYSRHHNQPHSSFPLLFTNIPLQNKSYFSLLKRPSKQIILPFNLFLQFLKNPSSKNQFIEPKLKEKFIKNYFKNTKCQISILKSQFQRTKIIQQNTFKGVFIHRNLNMKSDNYSFQGQQSSQEIVYRLKRKIGRSDNLKLHQQIKAKYEAQNWDYIYIQKYDRFIEKESIIRQLYEIDMKLEIELKTNKQRIVLGKDIQTRHLIQVEKIVLPYMAVDYFVTDIDFYMQGNAHTVDV